MGSDSKIEWTDATFNPWWGCVKVSPACAHCYAATLANRYGTEWGPNARRRFFGDKHWQEPVKWNRKAEREGRRVKVFCASMADVFEELPADHPDREQMAAERVRLFALIDATPHLDWLLLTKRPENIRRMWPTPADSPCRDGQGFVSHDFMGDKCMRCDGGHRQNCWLGCTVEDQANADKRIPELLKCRDLSPVLFLSCEPLLGPIVFRAGWLDCRECEQDRTGGTYDRIPEPCTGRCGIDLVIGGGESGAHARPTHPAWARSLRDQTLAARRAFFWKQWGEWANWDHAGIPKQEATRINTEGLDITTIPELWCDDGNVTDAYVYKVGKAAAGRLLDGIEHNGMPT